MFHPWAGKIPGRKNGNLLQYSLLKHPMDRGAWPDDGEGAAGAPAARGAGAAAGVDAGAGPAPRQGTRAPRPLP